MLYVFSQISLCLAYRVEICGYLHGCGLMLQDHVCQCLKTHWTVFNSQTLVKDLKGDTSGNFEDLLVALVTPPAEYDCHEVMRAMKVTFLNEFCLEVVF